MGTFLETLLLRDFSIREILWFSLLNGRTSRRKKKVFVRRVVLDIDTIMPGAETGWPFGTSQWVDWDDPDDSVSIWFEEVEARIMEEQD